MTTALLVLTCCLALLMLLMFGALVELYRQVEQLRQAARIQDEVMPVEYERDVRLADLNLTGIDETNVDLPHAIVFLSTSCSTCREIAGGIPRKQSGRLHVVIEAPEESTAVSWARKVGLDLSHSVFYDHGHRLADTLGVSVSPAAIRFEGGAPIEAATIPSRRQLSAVVDFVHAVSGREENISKVGTGEG